MATRNIGCLPVVEQGVLVGMLTRTNVLAHPASEPPRRLVAPFNVGDVMKPSPTTIRGNRPLMEAADLMVAQGVRHLPVVDAEDRVIGIVSDRDLRAAVGDLRLAVVDQATRDHLRGLRVWSAMTTPVRTVEIDTPLSDAIQWFVDHRVGALPVVDAGDQLVGILSYIDVLSAIRHLVEDVERAADSI
jgi:acetoin utilization protein AcuB